MDGQTLALASEVPSIGTASHAAYDAQQAMMSVDNDNACSKAVVQLVRYGAVFVASAPQHVSETWFGGKILPRTALASSCWSGGLGLGWGGGRALCLHPNHHSNLPTRAS